MLAPLALGLVFAGPCFEPPAQVGKALESITPDMVREHVEFLASDALEGRDTPSRGLDLAAKYIADQFEAAGLKPAAPTLRRDNQGSWFQSAIWNAGEFDPAKSRIHRSNTAGKVVTLEGAEFTAILPRVSPSFEFPTRILISGATLPKAADAHDLVLVLLDDGAAAQVDAAVSLGPRAVIAVGVAKKSRRPPVCPIVSASGDRLREFFADVGPGNDTITLELMTTDSARVHNVCGLLPGADLAREVVMVTAHYDHLGIGKSVDGDAIYNGADDDATGTTAMMAIAHALGAAAQDGKRARRSILFVAFFGEEKGLVGSSHYARHPLFPPADTVACVNIEMVGRPDDIKQNEAWVTGWKMSTFGSIIAEAGDEVGVNFYEREKLSAMLFSASDNMPLAKLGIPAHSISAGSLHKDYHQPSDEAEKIDFQNMAAVTRGLAYATFVLADGDRVPEWTEIGQDAGYTRGK